MGVGWGRTMREGWGRTRVRGLRKPSVGACRTRCRVTVRGVVTIWRRAGFLIIQGGLGWEFKLGASIKALSHNPPMSTEVITHTYSVPQASPESIRLHRDSID